MYDDRLRRALAAERAGDLEQAARLARARHPEPLAIRPVAREDRSALAAFFAGLSADSRFRRFLSPRGPLTDAELKRFTEVDHRTSEALLAVEAGGGDVLAIAQYAAWPGAPGSAELALAVADPWQGRGLGLSLARELVADARAHQLRRLTAMTLADNDAARRLLARLGFVRRGWRGPVVELELEL